MRSPLWSLLLVIFLTHGASAQSLSGKVVDSRSQAPIAFVSVFLNNTTLGTVTDSAGNFQLRAIKQPGSYELIFSFVGYQTYKTKITVAGEDIALRQTALVPSEQMLAEVQVSAGHDKAWEKDLKKFKKIFLGEDKLAASCSILNPWVIDFPEDKSGKKFLATASAPIELDNQGMGYKLKFYLTSFWSEGGAYAIVGNVQFIVLQSGDEKVNKKWQLNRARAYDHSDHHLFKSMIDHRIAGEGFELYEEREGYRGTTTRSADFKTELGKSVAYYDTTKLVSADKPGFYRIALNGRTEIHYTKDKATTRTYQDVAGKVSWMTLKKKYVVVNREGYPLVPTDVIVSGEMSYNRVADMLPIDFRPDAAAPKAGTVEEDDLPAPEQIYVQTDKPYYYPGETVWFKGYVNYPASVVQDSASRTVYVELIDKTTKSVVCGKICEIVDRGFQNNIHLQDTLDSQVYHLRAYTNYNRNFGDDNLYERTLPVLNSLERAVSQHQEEAVMKHQMLIVEADKSFYKPREKISLKIVATDEDETPWLANLSVSVVDSAQVADVKLNDNIVETFSARENKKGLRFQKRFVTERGITFSGLFLNDQGRAEEADLNIFQLRPKGFAAAHADAKGFFSVADLYFYDTAIFTVNSQRPGGKLFGKAILIQREPAKITSTNNTKHLSTTASNTPQRIFPEYEAPQPKLLTTIEVKGDKTNPAQFDRSRRPYGKPDHVLLAKDINASYGNLLQTLPGKFPGLVVREMASEGEGLRWVVYIQRQISLKMPAEVLVTVDDAIMSGRPANIISAIDPATIESIELKEGAANLFGSVGGSGILAFYTKHGTVQEQLKKNVPVLKVPGYSYADIFASPDYERDQPAEKKTDRRSTLYWNPTVETDATTGEATVSFFAADQPGMYVITIEGITQKGVPVRCVSTVRVKN
ncbi:CarboxypepD_reg-like domain-containing protein [Chryseolinea serpens]|uniref:CarboxypepD_reg-like domain-containing protein n=1 Tax=Chryseolinea serpens TaxID=947013 RepID=A0A1M5M6Z3_9BACT|nr:carboxypeptidase-like regulatory domain-containing protein [Chryseolinea serpens]SHG72709.1 CarboxypepD_reg-like domain-containing protein [Chryseolinea serpens]